jgi:hypothetical protein
MHPSPRSASTNESPTEPRRGRRVLAAVSVIVAVSAAVAACGDGGDETAATTTTEPITVVRWTAEVNYICERAQDFVDDLQVPENQEALASYLETAALVLEDQFTDIAEMESPPEVSADLDAALILAEKNGSQFERGLDAQATGDQATVDDAVSMISGNSQQLQIFFDDYALDRCWAGGPGDPVG